MLNWLSQADPLAVAVYDGQAGSYRFVRRISTDKRACVDWNLPDGWYLEIIAGLNKGKIICASRLESRYEDANSFFRAFHQWEGTSPGEWRAVHAHRASSNHASASVA